MDLDREPRRVRPSDPLERPSPGYVLTGGASSVRVVNGQYVSMYKSQIIRTITENEYRMFRTLRTRVMTAWTATMAVFGIAGLSVNRNQ